MRARHLTVLSLCTVWLLLGQVALAGDLSPPAALGQVVSGTVQVDGVRVPSGTTLLDGSLIQAVSSPALLRLRSGQVVTLNAKSSVFLEASGPDAVRVAVHSGEMFSRNQSGELTVKAAGSLMAFSRGHKGAAPPGATETVAGKEIASQAKASRPSFVALLTGSGRQRSAVIPLREGRRASPPRPPRRPFDPPGPPFDPPGPPTIPPGHNK